jgi:hypothetical protein
MARSASDKAAAAVKRAGVKGVNKPKRTPNHPTKSHVVVAKEGDKVKTIRFGQQGVSGSPAKKGESEAAKKRRKSFKARHASNIAKGKMSAAWWASKVKWSLIPIGAMMLLSSGGHLNAQSQPLSSNNMPALQSDADGTR